MTLDEMREVRDQIETQIQLKEARLKQKLRKEETRRKILVGALMLRRYEQEGRFEELISWLDTQLDRSIDRKLFGLSGGDQTVEHTDL